MDLVAGLTRTDAHFDQIVEAIAPQGKFCPVNAANLQRAHALIEPGTVRGKGVLEGWD